MSICAVYIRDVWGLLGRVVDIVGFKSLAHHRYRFKSHPTGCGKLFHVQNLSSWFVERWWFSLCACLFLKYCSEVHLGQIPQQNKYAVGVALKPKMNKALSEST